MQDFRRLLKYLRPHLSTFVLATIAMVFAAFWNRRRRVDCPDFRTSLRYGKKHTDAFRLAKIHSRKWLVWSLGRNFSNASVIYRRRRHCRVFFFVFDGKNRTIRRFAASARTLRTSFSSIGKLFSKTSHKFFGFKTGNERGGDWISCFVKFARRFSWKRNADFLSRHGFLL